MKQKKVNPDIDEQEEGVSYEKGKEFEEQFATFMKNELRWDRVRVGAHMTGRNNAKGTSIDVFGERLDAKGLKYKKRGDIGVIISAILAVFSLVWYLKQWDGNGIWFLIFSLTAFAAVSIFRILSGTYNKQNAWVECKNLKGKSNVNHISKMLREYQDFKSSKNEEHKFTHLYFVSANGYMENTLKMAMNNNIICYVKRGNTFQEVNYWGYKNN